MKTFCPIFYSFCRRYGHAALLGFFALSAGGCKEDPYELFDGPARLHFGPAPEAVNLINYRPDTLRRQTFAYRDASVTRDTVYFNIYTVGHVGAADRPFVLEQIQLGGVENAVPGVHYLPFDHPDLTDQYVIKAGTAHRRVPIVLLRDASLKTKDVVLGLKIKPNAHFLEGEAARLWRKVEFTDRLSRPQRWSGTDEAVNFGPYSRKKHQFMIDITGFRWDDEFLGNEFLNLSFRIYWMNRIKQEWEDRFATNPNEMIDENGDFWFFP